MFIVLGVLFCYSLGTFGAVLPAGWLGLSFLWLVAAAALLLISIFRRKGLDAGTASILITAAVLFGSGYFRLAAGLMALPWAFAAARRNPSSTQRFLHVLLVVGLLEALLGLFQFLVSPGWIFGYVNTSYRVSGTLINRNHFAGLLEMLIPITFGMAYVARRRYDDAARTYVYLLSGAFMGIALLFSVSRMGIFSFLVTTLAVTALLRLRRTQGGRSSLVGLATLGIVLAASLWIGVDAIVQRYLQLLGDETGRSEARLAVFRDVVHMIEANPLGVGPGHFDDRFPEYQTFRTDLIFEHAHNDYLEIAAEWGVLPALVFWFFIVFVLYRSIRLFLIEDSIEKRGVLIACAAAIFSLLLHSLMDFNLQIPSNAMLFFTFVGIALAQTAGEPNTLPAA